MKLVQYAIDRPKVIIRAALIITLLFAAFIPLIKIDTDPENMLAADEPVRQMHNQLKDHYEMHDILVLGIINEVHPEGVFNKQSLTRIYDISQYINQIELESSISKEDSMDLNASKVNGIIHRDIMGPSNIDHIESVGFGTLKFDWLMSQAPTTEDEALEVRSRLMSNEMFVNTIVSEDGKAICMYIPISSKDLSYKLSSLLKSYVGQYEGDDKFYITGLPVAEDTFGIEMFIQMAITAPAAMICIFFLMFLFFKKINLIISPMLVAMISVLCTMGLLIACGFTVHIMSSMIPIFVMPIAVLDSVHILSEFFDRYQETRDREKTLQHVMHELYKPMLFTSLTSAAGFASLALTPIPPVQVFGVFVAFGILLAWLVTILFIPAYIMRMSEESLEGFGLNDSGEHSKITKVLRKLQSFTSHYSKLILTGLLLLIIMAIYGIQQIQINDNPVKWFSKNHEIRVADRELNKHFGGTYMAYLSIMPSSKELTVPESKNQLRTELEKLNEGDVFPTTYILALQKLLDSDNSNATNEMFIALVDELYNNADLSNNEEDIIYWEELAAWVELQELSQKQVFKSPEVLDYIGGLENHLVESGTVGKINSLTKLIKKINLELHEGQDNYNKLPNAVSGVGQCIISYQNSHIPERLRHCVDTDFQGLNLWMQLKSGDNKDMEATMTHVEEYFNDNVAPIDLEYNWFGLTYINVVWQQKMVEGMVKAFLGSFVVVFLMMTFLFRSVKWAILCMLPLSVTIAVIYGVIGLIGKDYDMPVAVLSSLALGLAVDFSIHFLVRARQNLNQEGSWLEAAKTMFGEPSRAITRNIIVIAIGFLPLIFSSLVPYKTVGILLASILALSGLVTMVLLPVLIRIFEKYLIKK